MATEIHDILSAFGLTAQQSLILFSLEYQLTKKDIENTKSGEKQIIKKDWLTKWTSAIAPLLEANTDAGSRIICDYNALIEAFKGESSKAIKNTWFHLVILEATVFEAYTPLGLDAKEDQAYYKLRYAQQLDFIKEVVNQVGIGTDDMVERYNKAYTKALNTANAKTQKIITRALIVVASAGVIAATAGAAAGPIATALVGSQFAGLSGAALVNACLAALGGGAIAAGGAGMAGGALVIVGGGALLGAAGGSAAVAGFSAISKDNPDLAISQGAKLTVVLREIILNNQKDIMSAQTVLENYKAQLTKLQTEHYQMKLNRAEDAKAIKNLERAVEGLERLYHDANKFISAFGIGLETVAGQARE